MGMAIGQAKGGPLSEPNIVPLIDVLLVMIIIFMVITPKVPAGLPTLIPQSPATPSKVTESDPRTIVVQVLPGSQVLINEDRSDWNSLGPRLAAIFKERADRVAFVKGSSDVPFQEIARAIDIMRAAGIEHVGLVTTIAEAR